LSFGLLVLYLVGNFWGFGICHLEQHFCPHVSLVAAKVMSFTTDICPCSLLSESDAERKRCAYSLCCTSCAVGDLAQANDEETFCCAGNYNGACFLHGTLSALPCLGLEVVLGPFSLIFCCPLGGLLKWPYSCCIRRGIRQKHKIRGNCCHDFLCAYFCDGCAVAQELRETDIRAQPLADAVAVVQQPLPK
jgi:Cys-rich protein (TIGR01571 family)